MSDEEATATATLQAQDSEPLVLTVTEDKLVIISEEQLERLCVDLPTEWFQQLKQRRRTLKRQHRARCEALLKQRKREELRRKKKRGRSLEEPCSVDSTTA